MGKKVDRLSDFVTMINGKLKKSKSMGRIDLGRDIKYVDPPRIRTGSLGLDIITSGGIPRGLPTQMWGPFSSCKTTTCLQIGRSVQKTGGTIGFAAAETFDKTWARKNGLLIAYSDEELDAMRFAGKEELADSLEEEQATWPAFAVMQHTHGDGLLEVVYQAVKSNVFDYIIVDSLGAIRSYRDLEEHSLEDDKFGGEAKLFSAFTKKLYAAFNTKYDPATGLPTNGDDWEPNQTAVVCINQARDKIGGWSPQPGKVPQKSLGGEALKHMWGLSLEFAPGGRLRTDPKSEEGKKTYGMEVRVTCDKSKVGPPFREAEWDFYFEDHGPMKAGNIDNAKEVFTWANYYGLLKRSGSNYFIEGEKINGKDAALDFIRSEQAICDELYEQCLRSART